MLARHLRSTKLVMRLDGVSFCILADVIEVAYLEDVLLL